MTTMDQVKAVRQQFEREIAGYVIAHPDQPLDQIARVFRTSRRAISRIVEKLKLPARGRGHKNNAKKGTATSI